jgi:hypothetical protein
MGMLNARQIKRVTYIGTQCIFARAEPIKTPTQPI